MTLNENFYDRISDSEIINYDKEYDNVALDSSIDDMAFDDVYTGSTADYMDLSGNTTYKTENSSKYYQTLIKLNEKNTIDAAEVDTYFADKVYDFLNGYSEILLSYEEIDKLINNSGELISLNRGIHINKELEIAIHTQLGDLKRFRVDVINRYGYYAYSRLPDSTYFNEVNINANQDPIYDLNRIYKLVAYIVNYCEYKNNVSRETSSR